jgi:hypothetical protein
MYYFFKLKLFLTEYFRAKENLQQQLLRFVAPNTRCCAVVALLHFGQKSLIVAFFVAQQLAQG